jgi:hypothetical protein
MRVHDIKRHLTVTVTAYRGMKLMSDFSDPRSPLYTLTNTAVEP